MTDSTGRFEVFAQKRVTFITAEWWPPKGTKIRSGSITTFWRPSGEIIIKEEPIQPPQRNAGSRPSSDDLPESETPSSLGPRG
jgi:hypothetical protein